jgi:phospholipid/cholesterol/gamma-HCH transport system substrate-binding protein
VNAAFAFGGARLYNLLRMTAYQRNVLVGVVVLVGLGMLAWMVLQFAGQAATFFLTKGTHITLTTARAEGIADGSPVTYKGVNVGRVTGVRRVVSSDNHEDILIDALIDADPPLPANLHGRIKQTSLLGGSSMIALEREEPSTRPGASQSLAKLGEGANLQADFVPDVTSLTDSVQTLSNSAQSMINSINQVIGDPKVKEDIRAALTNARQTLENANKVSARLEKLGASFEKTADTAQATMGDIQVTVKDARGDIKRMTDSLNQRLEQIAVSLQRIQSVAQKIDEGKGTAGKLVNDPKLYDALTDTAAELKLTVKDLRRLIQQWEQEGIVKF